MSDLLFEIGTEEIPAGFLNGAAVQLETLFVQKVEKLELSFEKIKTYCTPRRLALQVTNLADHQKDRQEELLGPSKKAAFDAEGNPTKAAVGFARSKGVTVQDLKLVETSRGEYLQLIRDREGKPTDSLLPTILQEIVLELSFPKSMRWGSNQATFVRPIQWILALFGQNSIVFEHEGIVAGSTTRGHRFMAPEEIEVSTGSSYEKLLEKGSVIPDFERRKQMVLSEIKNAVANADFDQEAEVFIDDGLLATVTNLVEIPFGVCGRFDDKFLELPDEVLVTSMREHQKYFPVIDKNGALLPGFVAVNNTQVTDPELTREGHERVLRARLEDAYFFFESDKKIQLADRIEQLSGIIFQAKLGSIKEKTERIVKLTRLLCEGLNPDATDAACRAALLCKADLISDMVGEFPSLQGLMGGAYAAHDHESNAVSVAIKEHYMPLRAGSLLPSSPEGTLVGMADRIDTIAGCFGIGQQPTGTADPFGLRRLSLAVIHLIEKSGYVLSLKDIFQKALALYGERVNGSSDTVDMIMEFIKRRFINDCVRRGMDSRAVDAVTSVIFSDVNDCLERIEALSELRQDATFDVLAGSFKRIRNIVKDNRETAVDPTLFSEAAEEDLWSLFSEIKVVVEDRLENNDYRVSLRSMLALKDPVDRFFDDVMVMTDDERVRDNRLNILTSIGNLILAVGDISKMHAD
ncbi:MAG: glycine--tRNA ligase subunit beta [Deltaproteobacteria bacterium]|nr:glycine--tRNA ligase subunit beta [Deltaproteobacteria bacterium]